MASSSSGPRWARWARHTFRHPADRTEGLRRGWFERLAEAGSFLAGSPFFFAVCVAVILIWMVGLIVGAGDRFEVAIGGLISVLTLVLVALLKNAELRSERAIQQKLDAIASSLLQDKRGGDEAASERELEQAIGIHEEI
jgi:low affinity Fe/Cu permease